MTSEVISGLISLCGVLGAALIVLMGQRSQRGEDRRNTRIASVVEQCAHVIAAERDFRGRMWDDRKHQVHAAVRAWDPAVARLAFARISILARDGDLEQAALQLRRSGERLGVALEARREEELESLADEHLAALRAFESQSAEFAEHNT